MTNFLYNPDRKGKQQLIAEFVVRNHILDEIMQDVESSDMQTPEQHYLLVGQRGTGKTTILHRIKYAIEDSRKVNEWLIPVIFSEEQYNISELANLWENIAHILEDYHDFEGLYDEVERHLPKENFEEIIYHILEKHLDKHGKKLVLLIDNIGDLLRKLEDKEVRRLRELLQTKSRLRIIAASPFYLDNVLDYKQPLFEFFKVKRLDGLNKEETESLLLKLGEVYSEKEKIKRILKETPERIETLRILTGGVPRTIALMFRIFVGHEHESSVRDMERILDAVTPLYKHRMDDLPKQQQKIVDAVARHWDAISVKELKEKIRLDSKTISAQLNQLEKNQVVEKRIGKTKNHFYLVKERFWNIWYLMRYGRKFDRERVIWLVKFMECWFSSNELEQRVIDFTRKVNNNELPESTIELFGLVYASLENVALEVRMKLQDSLPEKMVDVISVDKGEILRIVNLKIESKEYVEALSLLKKVKVWDIKNKVVLANLLSRIHPDVVLGYFNEIRNSVSGLKNVDYQLIVLFLILYYWNISLNLNLGHNTEKILSSYQSAFSLIKDVLKDEFYDPVLEYRIIALMLKQLIIRNRIYIANEFFSGEHVDYFKSKLEISHTLVEYYKQNQDEVLLLRLPDEKKQIILKEIDEINKERNTFKP